VETAQFTGTVTWSPALNAGKLDADTLYTATITLTAKTGYTLIGVPADFFTVDGAKATYAANLGTVTAAVIRTDNPTTLNTATTGAIAVAKSYGGGAVIYLSPGFYGDANTAGNFIVVDPNATDNGTPYTIKGTGNTDTLTVGIVLANDNVTLDGVKIAVDTATKAADYLQNSSTYKAAITIERRSNATTAVAAAPTNVTIQNSNISYTAANTSEAAGIIVYGANGDVSTDILITDNTISLSRAIDQKTQGILLDRYGAGIEITGNVITSGNTSPGATVTPASAIAMVINPADVTTGEPHITGNTLKGDDFDFYITVLSKGDRASVEDLVSKEFGTDGSTWVSSGNNTFYKQLVTDLLPQSKGLDGNGGFGRLFLSLGGAAGSTGDTTGFALEYYEIDSTTDNITAINYYSPGITTPDIYDAGTNSTEAETNTDSFRGRLELVSGSFTPTGTFKWTRLVTGTNKP
jgi:hypothetical protein